MKSFSQFITEVTAHVYHGGNLSADKPLVTYWTQDREMALSYAEMSADRFGGDHGIIDKTLTLVPAPWSLIQKEARKVGIDPEDYTPASVFDAEIQGEESVRDLVKALKSLHYTGAILPDIAYGKQIEADAWIEFN